MPLESGTKDTGQVIDGVLLSEEALVVYLEGPKHEIVINSKGLTGLNEIGLALVAATICIEDLPEDLASELATINAGNTFKVLREAETAIASFRARLIELGVSE